MYLLIRAFKANMFPKTFYCFLIFADVVCSEIITVGINRNFEKKSKFLFKAAKSIKGCYKF